MSNTQRKSGQFGHQQQSQMHHSDNLSSINQPIDPQSLRSRLVSVWLFLGMAALGLGLRLTWLQVVDATTLLQKAKAQQSVTIRPFVPRRTIVDRSNNQLAIDRPSYTIYAHPIQFREFVLAKGSKKTRIKVPVTRVDMATKIAPILGVDRDRLIKKFNDSDSGILLGKGLREDIGIRLKALQVDGLDIRQGERDYTRFYPQGDLAAEILGYLDQKRIAQAGVELSKSAILRRKVSKYKLTQTKNGEVLPDLANPTVLHADDLKLQLTVDNRLQQAARNSLRQQMQQWNAPRGTVIVMDAESGAIRALVVEPTYDPNYYSRDLLNYSKIVGKKQAFALLRNWAVSDLYEPGSTFKPIAVAIALENGIVKPNSTFDDNGKIQVGKYTIRNADLHANGNLDLAQILQHSSNVGMVKMMQRLKPGAYYDWLQRIGLGQKSGIDLPLETRGEVRSRQEFISTPIYPANTAFGQGFSLTPVQLVTLMGSLANGGKLVTPHVVEGLFDSTGVRRDKPSHPEPTQIFSSTTTKAVLEMMETVVTKGSGVKAQISGYRIAGKTGTSQKAIKGGYGDNKITSFVGILPVDGEHRYVVFAAVDEPRGKEKAFGSNVAAPIVKSVMESLIAIEGIPPSHP